MGMLTGSNQLAAGTYKSEAKTAIEVAMVPGKASISSRILARALAFKVVPPPNLNVISPPSGTWASKSCGTGAVVSQRSLLPLGDGGAEPIKL